MHFQHIINNQSTLQQPTLAITSTPDTQKIPTTLLFRPLPSTVSNETSLPTKIVTVDTPTGSPCRRCLQDGKQGEKLLLFSYDPWLGDSAYRQPGPIFVHAEPKCELAIFKGDGTDGLPEQQRKRFLSVRAIDVKNDMIGYDTLPGTELVERAERFFKEDEDVKYLHVHYAGPGCFGVRIDRGHEGL